MNRRVESQLPRARQERLVVQDLPDELLIYDLERHRAYCLNRAAAFVWQSCDGRRTVAVMTRALEKKIDHPVDENFVWFALDQLSRYRLLEEQVELPVFKERMTRRELARRLGFATAALVPLITAIVAPTAAQTATCGNLGSPCTTNARCCTKLCINGTCVCLDVQSPCSQSQPEQCCSGRCGSANDKCLP
jgi:hypothetical protein